MKDGDFIQTLRLSAIGASALRTTAAPQRTALVQSRRTRPRATQMSIVAVFLSLSHENGHPTWNLNTTNVCESYYSLHPRPTRNRLRTV